MKKKKLEVEPGFKKLLYLVALTVLAGTLFYHFAENLNWLDSIYFSVITLTTIGYGEIVPTTAISKIFTIFYSIIGIGIIFTFISIISRRNILRRD